MMDDEYTWTAMDDYLAMGEMGAIDTPVPDTIITMDDGTVITLRGGMSRRLNHGTA